VLAVPAPHSSERGVGKSEVSEPDSRRSVQLLLSAEPPFTYDQPSMTACTRKIDRVGIYTSLSGKLYTCADRVATFQPPRI
jgi:protein tyrosine/serine phosphatase